MAAAKKKYVKALTFLSEGGAIYQPGDVFACTAKRQESLGDTVVEVTEEEVKAPESD